MPLNIKTFDQYVSDLVAAWAAELGLSPTLTSGDPLLAIMQSVASQNLFLQQLAVAIFKFARASTATAEDLDSWLFDFGFYRLPATQAEGTATFGVLQVKTSNTLIPIGKKIQTFGGAIVYEVIEDLNMSSYSIDQQAYVITAGQLTCNATVRALNAGAAYNAQVGQLNQFADTITGVDSVTNNASITNGLDPETDEKVRARFILWINSLSKATKAAVEFAIQSVQQGINYNLLENIDQNLNARTGFFTAVIDDGTGAPSSTLMSNVTAAIEKIRGFTIAFTAIAPSTLKPLTLLNVKIRDGASSGTVLQNVKLAVINYINSLKIGETLYIYNLINVAMNADSGVKAVQVNSVLIGGTEADYVANGKQVIRADATTVTIGTW